MQKVVSAQCDVGRGVGVCSEVGRESGTRNACCFLYISTCILKQLKIYSAIAYRVSKQLDRKVP